MVRYLPLASVSIIAFHTGRRLPTVAIPAAGLLRLPARGDANVSRNMRKPFRSDVSPALVSRRADTQIADDVPAQAARRASSNQGLAQNDLHIPGVASVSLFPIRLSAGRLCFGQRMPCSSRRCLRWSARCRAAGSQQSRRHGCAAHRPRLERRRTVRKCRFSIRTASGALSAGHRYTD